MESVVLPLRRQVIRSYGGFSTWTVSRHGTSLVSLVSPTRLSVVRWFSFESLVGGANRERNSEVEGKRRKWVESSTIPEGLLSSCSVLPPLSVGRETGPYR